MSPIQISAGDLRDLDAVMAVMEQSFDPSYGEAWTAQQCAGLLPMTGVWLSLAQHEELVIGFALSRIVLKEAELLLLAVKRDRQGSGTGRALLDHFVLDATARGAERLHLEVRDGNHAMNLYRRGGFTEAGRRKHYYRGRDGQVYDALTLSRRVG